MALVDMFLKLDGVEGESKDPKHSNEIKIEGFRVGAESPWDAHTNQKSGKVQMAHLTIHAKVDKSTPKIFDMITKNIKIPKATLTCRKAGTQQEPYLTVTLTDVLVVRVQAGDPGTDSVLPPCTFDLGYSKIEMEAREQTEKGPTGGPVKFLFNLSANA